MRCFALCAALTVAFCALAAAAQGQALAQWSMQLPNPNAKLLVDPVYVDGTDFVVFIDTAATISGVNVSSQAVLWTRGLNGMNVTSDTVQLLASPSNNAVVVSLRSNTGARKEFGNQTGALISLDAATGAENWARDTPGLSVAVPPAGVGQYQKLFGATVLDAQVVLVVLYVDWGETIHHAPVALTLAPYVTAVASGNGVRIYTPVIDGNSTSWFVTKDSDYSVWYTTTLPILAEDSEYAVVAQRDTILRNMWDVTVIKGDDGNEQFSEEGAEFYTGLTAKLPNSNNNNNNGPDRLVIATDNLLYMRASNLPGVGIFFWVDLAGPSHTWAGRTFVVVAHMANPYTLNMTGHPSSNHGPMWHAQLTNVDSAAAKAFIVADVMFLTGLTGGSSSFLALNAVTGASQTVTGQFVTAVGTGLKGTFAFVETPSGLQLFGFTASAGSTART